MSTDYSALGQAIDTTWGRSSTPKSSSFSIKMTLKENVLCLTYIAIVNFNSERQMIESRMAYSEESRLVTTAAIKKVKEVYKDLSGDALKIKMIEGSETDSVDVINTNFYNANRKAYFRHKANFQLDD